MANAYGYYRMPRRHSIFIPLLLIVIGALFLLRNAGYNLHLGYLFARYWPLILVAWGVVRLLEFAWARKNDEPAPRMGGGTVVLIVLLILFGTGLHKSADINWDEIGNQVDVDNDIVGVMGNSYPYTDESEQPFTEGQRLKVVCEHGDVKIHPGDAGKIKVVAHKKIMAGSEPDARKLSDESKPSFTVENGVVTLNANIRAQGSGITVNHGFHIGPRVTTDLDVYLPLKASVEVDTRHGDIVITDREGDLRTTSSHGDSTVENVTGNVSLNVQHGSVKVQNVKGNVSVDGRIDDTDIATVSGDLSLNGEYPSSVKLSNIAGATSFHSSVTDLRMGKLHGELTLDGSDLHATSVTGPVQLNTHSKDIHFDDVSGDIKVENNHGDIELHSVKPMGSIDVLNRNGAIRLWVPPDAAFQLEAHASHGDIEDEFGLPTSSAGSVSQSQGTIGKGGQVVHLTTDHASIELHKQGATSGKTGGDKAGGDQAEE